MSFGAIAVVAGIVALEPAFTTGAALGVALVVIGLGISFLAAEHWGLLGTATTIIGALLLAGGVALPETQTKPVPFDRIILLSAKQTNAPKKGNQDMEAKCGPVRRMARSR